MYPFVGGGILTGGVRKPVNVWAYSAFSTSAVSSRLDYFWLLRTAKIMLLDLTFNILFFIFSKCFSYRTLKIT